MNNSDGNENIFYVCGSQGSPQSNNAVQAINILYFMVRRADKKMEYRRMIHKELDSRCDEECQRKKREHSSQSIQEAEIILKANGSAGNVAKTMGKHYKQRGRRWQGNKIDLINCLRQKDAKRIWKAV